VKIKGTCDNCDREFLVEQVLETGGSCPWCGRSFQADYAAVLVEALRSAESAGATLENALEKVAEVHPKFELDSDSVLDGLKASLV
jgi:hypothetical protein